MKKVAILLVVAMMIFSVIPVFTYAAGHDRNRDRVASHDRNNDQAWRHQHDQMWKAHEKQWSDYDRQWRQHSGDRHWREQHIKMWSDWYQWHKDNESILKIKVSADSHGGPRLDIDFRK